jgi:hypothetical protein
MKNDQNQEKKEKWTSEIKHFSRIFIDFATNRIKKQHDKSSRQKLVSEQWDYEFEEHEKALHRNSMNQFKFASRSLVNVNASIVINQIIDFDLLWKTQTLWSFCSIMFAMKEYVQWFRYSLIRTFKIMMSLQYKSFDAIQKFWRNSFASISLNNNQNDFHLLYKSKNDIRICFYVNDQINIDNWKIEYFTIDFSVFKMIVKEVEEDTKMIRIHNVYNSSFVSYTSKDNSFTLSKIMRFIVETLDDHHILLNDFNLHHFFEAICFVRRSTSRQTIYSI